MESLKIIAFATLAAIVYGILHDQVTAHLCVEYFTIAHPPVFPTSSPFLLALGWGVIATWWVGLPLGVLLAIVARAGGAPRLVLVDLRGAILRLMLVSAVGALLAGIAGATATTMGAVTVSPYWASVIPPAKHVAFLADAWAHGASYLIGAIGGLVVIGYAIARRRQLRRA
ncbi:hypothetical protein [uncultured Sphingomonas sp.]|uniref:hypothetical protein n=1 Tax=uncultured Sphingomonas sp. TaxID=158754 RepID=UPI0025FF1C61|nr:hypothetical protein [uncultured Sphingomonas sp.]